MIARDSTRFRVTLHAGDGLEGSDIFMALARAVYEGLGPHKILDRDMLGTVTVDVVINSSLEDRGPRKPWWKKAFGRLGSR